MRCHGLNGKDLGEGRQRAEHAQLTRKAVPFILYSSSFGPSTCAWGGSKPGRKLRPKVDGGLTTGACWAPRRFTGIAALPHCTLDLSLGACVGLEGCTYVEALHQAANGRPKVNGGHATGARWAPRAVYRDRWLHCTLLPQLGTRGLHRGRQHARSILVVAWRNWTACRSWRIDLSGLHQAVESERQATCWRLFPLLNSGPTCSFPIIVQINMDLYIPWESESIHVMFLPEGQKKHGQQIRPVRLVRILLKGLHGRLECHNVAWLYLAWVGVWSPPPHPLMRSCTYARHSSYVGRCEKALSKACLYCIYWKWALVACSASTWFGTWW